MRNAPSNSDDVLDSRDIIARIEELESERDAYDAEQTDADHADWSTDCPDDASELAALIALQEEAEGYSDWKHGATLIRDTCFEDYAQQIAEDVGAIDPSATWPLNCIDWERAARELRMDYTSVDFDGVTYWVRS